MIGIETIGYNPSVVMFLGALILYFVRGNLRKAVLLIVPLIALYVVHNLQYGFVWNIQFHDFALAPVKVDKLSKLFGYVFTLAAFYTSIYNIRSKKDGEHPAAFAYASGALGVVFAGDLVTLFFFWELLAFSAVFLIFMGERKESIRAGFRYILVHTTAGLCLLAGVYFYYQAESTLIMKDGLGVFLGAFQGTPGYYLILLGFMINGAVPPLHAWLTDAYPESTIGGGVYLSALTTKTAVAVLARGFAGEPLLLYLGAIMTLYGVVFAVLENDIRRLLSYHIVSQVGYMVAGIGIGTTLAINGALSHAFTHIIYKGLLFMGAGAVMYSTGRSKLTELGGVYKYMPATFFLYMIGGFAISSFPLTSGFVSKSITIAAAGEEHLSIIWMLLSLSAVGTFLHTGLKLPYFTFFYKKYDEKGVKPLPVPFNMKLAMGIAAFFCIGIGIYPQPLYNILPYGMDFQPYTISHVLWSWQSLLFCALAFFMFAEKAKGKATISIDTDWFYRKGSKLFIIFIRNLPRFGLWTEKIFFEKGPHAIQWFGSNPYMATKYIINSAMGRDVDEIKSSYPNINAKFDVLGTAIMFVFLTVVIGVMVWML